MITLRHSSKIADKTKIMAKNQKNSRTNYDNIETDRQPSNSTIIAARNLPDRWEYVLVTFHDYRGWRPRYINGHELSDWMNNPVIHEYIEKMAEDGKSLLPALVLECMEVVTITRFTSGI